MEENHWPQRATRVVSSKEYEEKNKDVIRKHRNKSTYLRRQTIPMARMASQMPTASVTMITNDVPATTHKSTAH